MEVTTIAIKFGMQNYLMIAFCCFLLYFYVVPVIRFYSSVVKASCKPVSFSYQHVLITGGGTGLGRSLTRQIFTRGAVITMIGKDKAKLQ
jgi:hypothetical protein